MKLGLLALNSVDAMHRHLVLSIHAGRRGRRVFFTSLSIGDLYYTI
jgi:hypothetical protein